jgi:hypothetical protein
MSHDRNFKNLVLDYPRQAPFFAFKIQDLSLPVSPPYLPRFGGCGRQPKRRYFPRPDNPT